MRNLKVVFRSCKRIVSHYYFSYLALDRPVIAAQHLVCSAIDLQCRSQFTCHGCKRVGSVPDTINILCILHVYGKFPSGKPAFIPEVIGRHEFLYIILCTRYIPMHPVNNRLTKFHKQIPNLFKPHKFFRTRCIKHLFFKLCKLLLLGDTDRDIERLEQRVPICLALNSCRILQRSDAILKR